MTGWNRFLSSVCAAAFLAVASAEHGGAQQARDGDVLLIADSVFLQGNNTLIARGNVEAIRGDVKMTAKSITYNSREDTITVEGPIVITEGESSTVYAEFAELDTDMQNGLLRSARIVLDQQVQITADQMRRSEGRYSTLDRVTATSCKTCDDGRPPLWQIRAKKVVHDQVEKQLYFDDAQFRIMDVPVFYVPRLRLPDPTLDRASGFLIPEIRSRSRLGIGVKVPYFIRLGDHRDLTLTPFVSANTNTLELRYRQAFVNGNIEFNGAISDDNFGSEPIRGYVFGNGRFDLKRDYVLSFDIKSASDDAYLLDYDYSDLDRLNSEVAISRANRLENTKVALMHFETLRASESNETLPSVVLSARKEKRFFPTSIGGEGHWELEFHTHTRRSSADTDLDADGVVDGRDVMRVNGELDWRRNWILPGGFEFGVVGDLALDAVTTNQDATITDTSYAQITPAAAVNLRYPMIRSEASGATQILEPIAQIGWSGGDFRTGTPSNVIANDESSRVEFDEGNLLSLSRFPSDDRRERGFVAAWGVNWSRIGTDWDAHVTLGQVVRRDAHSDFSSSSGLEGLESDYLVAAKLENQAGLNFTTRLLVDGIDGLNKAETRGGWHNDNLSFDATYIWLDQDPAENRGRDLSEWNLDSKYRFSRHWSGLANWRYDVASQDSAEAGLGVEYQNECVKANFSVSRRFTSSTTVQPSTDLSFTIEILGFSAKSSDQSYTRTCRNSAG